MNKKLFQYNIYSHETGNATGKAKMDADRIFRELGFQDLYQPSKYRTIRIFQQALSLSTFNTNDVLFIQYPANLNAFYRIIIKKNINAYALIHDLSSLRGDTSTGEELEILHAFQGVISHNPYMTKYLRENGYTGKIVELGFFDYLLSSPESLHSENGQSICFAGNLDKSTFIKKLNDLDSLQFNVYGKCSDERTIEGEIVKYCGSYSSEEIVHKLDGSWGLVWDGPSIDSCDGINGEYLKFNCPHKASMYVVAEKPLIVWENAAIADSVRQYGLGIVVKSLREVSEKISSVSQNQYKEIKKNVREMKEQLIRGNNLKLSINRILDRKK